MSLPIVGEAYRLAALGPAGSPLTVGDPQIGEGRRSGQRRCWWPEYQTDGSGKLSAPLLCALPSHPQHRPHAYPEIARDSADPDPLGPRRDNCRYFARVAIFQPPPAKLDTIGLCLGSDRP
jgi:hypothetical protein